MFDIRNLLRFRIKSVPILVGFLLLLAFVQRSRQNWETLSEFTIDRKPLDLLAVRNGVWFVDKPPVTNKKEIQEAIERIVEGAHRNTVFMLGESRFTPTIVVQPKHRFSDAEIKKVSALWANSVNYEKIYSKDGLVFTFDRKVYQAIATTVKINASTYDLLAFTSISRTVEKAYLQSLIELSTLLLCVSIIILIILNAVSKSAIAHSKSIYAREKSKIKWWWPLEIQQSAENYNNFLDAENIYKVQIDQSTSGQLIVRAKGLNEGIIYSSNKALSSISGYTQEELDGHPLNLIVPKEYHAYHFGLGVYDDALGRRVGLAAYAQGCPFHKNHESRLVGRDRTVELLHKDGTTRKIILGIIYLGRNTNGEDEWSGVATDVTQLTDAVTKAEESAKSEREIREEFEQLQQSWRHDLLSAVLGTHNMFEVLDKIGFKVEKAEHQEPYNLARAKAQFAYRLVRDTRDLNSSIESLECNPISLRSVMASIKILYPEADINYSITDEDAQVSINESSFVGRAISNIINNAIKFSGLNGIIEVGIRTKDNHAIIFVKDNGIGMDEEGQKKIFSGMGTGVRLRQDIQGDGLGLHSASGIIRAHGGALTVKSQLGQGSVFFIKIPLLR